MVSVPQNLKKGCWLTNRDFGNNHISATKECLYTDGKAVCTECIRYIHFYAKVDKLERLGIGFGDAVKRVRQDKEEKLGKEYD